MGPPAMNLAAGVRIHTLEKKRVVTSLNEAKKTKLQ